MSNVLCCTHNKDVAALASGYFNLAIDGNVFVTVRPCSACHQEYLAEQGLEAAVQAEAASMRLELAPQQRWLGQRRVLHLTAAPVRQAGTMLMSKYLFLLTCPLTTLQIILTHEHCM